jgi:hypothetical protein
MKMTFKLRCPVFMASHCYCVGIYMKRACHHINNIPIWNESLRVRITLYKQIKEQLLLQMKLYHTQRRTGKINIGIDLITFLELLINYSVIK